MIILERWATSQTWGLYNGEFGVYTSVTVLWVTGWGRNRLSASGYNTKPVRHPHDQRGTCKRSAMYTLCVGRAQLLFKIISTVLGLPRFQNVCLTYTYVTQMRRTTYDTSKLYADIC